MPLDELMTDNEIIKALECCGKSGWLFDCEGCPCYDENEDIQTSECQERLMNKALDLINRQQEMIDALIAGQETLQKALAEKNAEIEKLKDSRDRWKRNALSFDEASRETEKELEKLYAEIEEYKNNCDKCGAKTRACIESLQNNIAEKQAEVETLKIQNEHLATFWREAQQQIEDLEKERWVMRSEWRTF
ncbi:MAG: hypothetical protein IIW48_10130 [Clostridia bacterium]|nr:hypothetical protein [Clostridia bacterium]